MSIQIKEVISVQDYKSVNTNLIAVEDNDIQAAINNCYLLLNGICNNQIGLRWDITDTNNKDYLSETQKQLIQQAFLIQTKYILDYNLTSAYGNQQFNEGSISGSINTPRHNLICQECLNFLAKAGVYKQVVAQKVNDLHTKLSNVSSFEPTLKDSIATISYVQQYAMKKNLDYSPDGRQLIYYDSNGVSNLISFSGFMKEININLDDIYYQISMLKNIFNQNMYAIQASLASLENRVLKLEQGGTGLPSIETIITNLQDKYPANIDLIKDKIAQDNYLTQEQKDNLIVNGVFGKNGTLIISSKMYNNSINIEVEYYNATCKVDGITKYIYDFNKVFCLFTSSSDTLIHFEDGSTTSKQFFDSEIEFNEKTNIDYIEIGFLDGCVNYNKRVRIPNNIVKVGNAFLYNCYRFNNIIVLGDLRAEIFEKSSWTLATNEIDVPMYQNGVEIVGTYKQDFLKRFPNSDKKPYRKLI